MTFQENFSSYFAQLYHWESPSLKNVDAPFEKLQLGKKSEHQILIRFRLIFKQCSSFSNFLHCKQVWILDIQSCAADLLSAHNT